MTDLKGFRDWLCSFPGWEGKLPVDYLDHTPGSCGLFYAGQEEKARRQDLLGNVTARCRCKFILYRVAQAAEDNLEQAGWLLALENWLQAQSALALAPRLGADPTSERIYSEKGHFTPNRQTGTGIYQVAVWAEYTKIYHV